MLKIGEFAWLAQVTVETLASKTNTFSGKMALSPILGIIP